jgi:hypothetical protein
MSSSLPPKDQNEEDDSDLADLLGSAASSDRPAMISPASGPYAKQQERVYQNYYQRHDSMSFCGYISAYISM